VTLDWDEGKRRQNLQKHGIDFVDAIEVFFDPHRLEGFDSEHSRLEDRWWTVGLSAHRTLFVVFAERHAGRVVRIISARKAMRHEQEAYQERRAR
jgi:uncharacterized DUF497 family protein